MQDWIATITVLFAAVGALAVLIPAWLSIRNQRRPQPPASAPKKPDPPTQSRTAITLQCPICQNDLALAASDLRPLTPPEVALIIGQRKDAAGHKLAEALCPRCDACFTFIADGRQPRLLGTNIFHAQQKGNRCTDCGRPLKKLPWNPEKFTTIDQVRDALEPLHGLDCDHCGAVCCLACCEDVSRNRTTDNTLMCPRCRRRPMQTLHYF